MRVLVVEDHATLAYSDDIGVSADGSGHGGGPGSRRGATFAPLLIGFLRGFLAAGSGIFEIPWARVRLENFNCLAGPHNRHTLHLRQYHYTVELLLGSTWIGPACACIRRPCY